MSEQTNGDALLRWMRKRGLSVTEGKGVNGRDVLIELLIDGDPTLEPVQLEGMEMLAFASGVEYGMLLRDTEAVR